MAKGQAVCRRPCCRKRNPELADKLREKAGRLWKAFTGRPVDETVEVALPKAVKGMKLPPLTVLGIATSVSYLARKHFDQDELIDYVHDFEGEVILASDPSGRVLFLFGPDLQVKDVGITG